MTRAPSVAGSPPTLVPTGLHLSGWSLVGWVLVGLLAWLVLGLLLALLVGRVVSLADKRSAHPPRAGMPDDAHGIPDDDAPPVSADARAREEARPTPGDTHHAPRAGRPAPTGVARSRDDAGRAPDADRAGSVHHRDGSVTRRDLPGAMEPEQTRCSREDDDGRGADPCPDRRRLPERAHAVQVQPHRSDPPR